MGEDGDVLGLALRLVEPGQATAIFPRHRGLMAKLLPSPTSLASLDTSPFRLFRSPHEKGDHSHA